VSSARSGPAPTQTSATGPGALRRISDRVLALDQRPEAQENTLVLETVPRQKSPVLRHRRVLWPDAAMHDGHVIGGEPELVGKLAPGELAVRDHTVRGREHALLDQGIQRTRIEMVMMRHHGNRQVVATARQERGRADESHGVGAQEIEGACVPHAFDRAWPHEGRDVPAKPLRGPHGVHVEAGHAALVGLPSREQDVALDAQSGQTLEKVALVDLAARSGFGRDAAVGRADPHQATPSDRATARSVSTTSARSSALRSGELDT